MRRIERVTIPGGRSEAAGERDNGKTFVLTEMNAYDGQDFALRCLLAMAAGGLQVPAGAFSSGWEGLAPYAFASLLQAPYGALKPLLNDLLAQVQYEHRDTKGKPLAPVPIVAGLNCQIEEITTFLTLYKAVFEMHANFSPAANTPTTG